MRLYALALAAFSLMLAASAQAGGDVASGEALARDHCIRCHDVGPGGGFKQHPPSFASIAVFRPPDQIKGRILFPVRHANMPQLGYVLSPQDVDDLVVYIMSLEARSR